MSTSIYATSSHNLKSGTYTVYITINLINLNYYIGVHKIPKKLKPYYGSGYNLKRAIKQYGNENFYQSIIYVAKNKEDAYDVEAKIVTEEFISRRDTYNIHIGGYMPPSIKDKTAIYKNNKCKYISRDKINIYLDDGWQLGTGRYYKHSEETKKKMSKIQCGKIFSEETKKKMSKSHIGVKKSPHSEETKKKMSDANKGKKRTEETKKLISKAFSNRVWINNGIECKFDKIETLQKYLDDGWIRGRIKTSK